MELEYAKMSLARGDLPGMFANFANRSERSRRINPFYPVYRVMEKRRDNIGRRI